MLRVVTSASDVVDARTAPRDLLPAERDPVFGKCAACHPLRPGIHGIGPSLAGVYGREAGTARNYRYSSEFSDQEIVWDAATLDRWLKDPRNMVPQTRMLFAGIANPLERATIIAFLQREARSDSAL
jgi:cytochrome c